MSDSGSTSPPVTLDASGVLTWTLLRFLTDRLPSGNVKRGNERLDEALRLAHDHKDVINSRDMEAVKDRITQ